jgi:hypothetical protein
MNRLIFVYIGALVLLCATAGPVAAAPMFVNGGFETGDFTGWTVSGNAEHGVAVSGTPITGTVIAGNLVKARTGDYAAFAKFQGGTSPTTLVLEQTVELDPGVTYSVNIRRTVFGDGDAYRWSESLKYSAGDGSTGSISGGFRIGPSWSNLTISGFTATAGQTTKTLRFEFGGYELDSKGLAGFSIDDISIQPVPEPASVCALALASMTVMGRRRRRRGD